ncbi:MAG: NAD(P)H-dependent oxidoreductase subunit E [Rhodocyclaceae bacterium]|jgi:(2Fe-2S) ferredoxin|nr:NAD(P)H-dependent oxidoreductase subunit E [Rhodocyclaceae bacterium]MDO9601870.1 NAD(P)H-dependent oxidoreductase subunit E [Rhodocyclaceae bacterium]MDP2107731.1 NAD(P)H-dependent oxidoreductase subunit E [Rhodocyclaceae bacterium]MDP2195250.1 NAD(P)H-dependent oxidoreductase subunit E [Rhodocyclaceae bacterium]
MSYYKHHVFFCTNQREGDMCCNDHNAQAMRDYCKERVNDKGEAIAGNVRINSAGCLDRCGDGPVIVVYPEAVWYTYVDQEDIDEIVDSHLVKGQIVERLKIG